MTIAYSNTSLRLISRITSPSGRFLSFTYDSNNRVSRISDHTGRSVGYAYNAAGTLDTVTYPDGTFEHYTYDSGNRMLTIQDRRGNIQVTNQYDVNGRVQQQTLADNAVYRFAYTTDGSGRVTQADATDPLGIVRHLVFDSAGYPVTDIYGYGQADAQTYSFQRDPQNDFITQRTDPLGRVTRYVRDAFGYVTSKTLLAGTANAVTYSTTFTPDYHQTASVTDPLNHTTTYTYTSGCLTQIKDALGQATNINCNAAGQRTSLTDPLGHTIQYAYSIYDLSAVTDALSRTTNYYRDDLGRAISMIDPLGNVALSSYDVDDRLVSTTDALGYSTQYGYDNNGNRTAVTDPANGVMSFGYDPRNRLSSTTDALLHIASTTYDGLGNFHTATDRDSQTTTAGYDDLGRLASRTYADHRTTQLQYDAGNRLTAIIDSVSGTITRSYDGLDRLTQEQTPQGTVSYGYDAASRRTSMQVAGQPAIAYSYDDANRLATLGSSSETVSYSFDAANRRTGLTLPNGVQTVYSYDAANELTGLDYQTSSSAALGNLVYGYDLAGRRTSTTGSWASDQLPNMTPANLDYQYNAENRLTGGNAYSPAYDNEGQMTADGQGKTYVWNPRRQLTQIQAGPVALASFQYDALGRRIGKTVNGTATAYLYDGVNTVQEQQGSKLNNLLTGLGIDEHYGINGPSSRLYLLADAVNSTVAMTNAGGGMSGRYVYDPYGNYSTQLFGASLPAIGPLLNPYTYTGREDDGTGLYYYRARYYNPSLQRFISEDPIGLAGGPNVYAYVGGNPISETDPLGLMGSRGYVPPPPMNIIHGIPPDAVPYTAPNGQTFYAPPQANFCQERAAGQANGLNPFAMNQAIGQGGTYDYQRSGNNFYPAYTNAANFGVGVYMNGAGASLSELNAIGGAYSFLRSSNANSAAQVNWWDQGWNAANSNSSPCQCQ